MNARVPPSFQRPSFPSQMPQKSNLEVMKENMFMAQQKQDEYIKQLASKVDVLTTHNRMLEAQIAQEATFSSTPLAKLPTNLNLTLKSTTTVLPWRRKKRTQLTLRKY